MSVIGGFFNSRIVNGQYDRTYLAEDFAKCMQGLVSNGVVAKYSDHPTTNLQLKVLAGPAGTMQLKVLPGKAWVNGYWFENTTELVLTAPPFNLAEQRACAVVLRLDYAQRKFIIYVKEGSLGNPSTIPIQRDDEAYELFLANYNTKPTYTDITDVMIGDTRVMPEYCGFCRMVINAVDGKNNLVDISYDNYQQLTIEDKNNGTAYFITDKGYIMRNSVFYGYTGPTIAEPMTQEEYDLIDNPDENTLYIIKGASE